MITKDRLISLCRAPKQFIKDEQGQIIGDSQELARTLWKLAKAMDDFADDVERVINKMADRIEAIDNEA